MGEQTDAFKCPHCEAQIESTAGPNFTAVGGPGPVMSVVIVSSCPSCERAFGAYLMPPNE